jgi:hypothetical protein
MREYVENIGGAILTEKDKSRPTKNKIVPVLNP